MTAVRLPASPARGTARDAASGAAGGVSGGVAGGAVSQAAPQAGFGALPRKPVSDVKREGWRAIMRTVDSAGTLLMTNHDQPEAVILSLREYRQLTELAAGAERERKSKLDELSRAFDADLAMLRQPQAASRLRDAFAAPLALNGQVIAGKNF